MPSVRLAFILIALVSSSPVAAEPAPSSTLPVSGWQRHDFWSGLTTDHADGAAQPVATLPYAPAARRPSTTTMRIVGTDDLQPVTNTTTYPHSAIVKLWMTFSNGMQGVCSGTMVSPTTVLTAAHCVFDPQHGGWPARVQAAPGLYGDSAPFGVVEASAVAAHNAFTQAGDQRFDVGVVQLDGSEIGYTTGWLGLVADSDAGLQGGAVTVAGYPADRDQSLVMYQQTGPIMQLDANLLSYEMDSFGGMSGGPVYRVDEAGARLVGVHAWESVQYAFNGGTRLTTDNLALVNAWIAEGPFCQGGACERPECADGACADQPAATPDEEVPGAGATPPSSPYGDPSNPYGNPYGNPAAGQPSDPYGSPYGNPYGPPPIQFSCSGGASASWLAVLVALALVVRRRRTGRV